MFQGNLMAMLGRPTGAGFDPATLNLLSYFGRDYTVPPWVGRASAGSSGTKDLVGGGVDPGASGGVALFTGTESLTGLTLTDLLGVGDTYGIHIPIYPTFLPPDPGPDARYMAGPFSDLGGGYACCAITDSSTCWQIADGIGFASHLQTGPLTLNAWNTIQIRSSGVQLQMRINGGSWASEAYGPIAPVGMGGTYSMGTDYTGALFMQARVKGMITSGYRPDDAESDAIHTFLAAM